MNLSKDIRIKLHRYFFTLVFITVGTFAFFLRAQETISRNFLFLMDQGRDMMAVREIVFGHHLTLIGPYTSIGGVFQGPLYYYLLSIPAFIFNGDPWGALLLMLIISLSVILIATLWTYKLFGKNAALVAFVLFSLSPQAIVAAQFTWNPHPMWLPLVIFVYSFIEVNLGRKKYSLIMWPAIAIMFHFEMAFGVFVLFGTIIFFLLINRKTMFNRFALTGMIIGSLFFLPQILFELRHNFLMTRAVIEVFKGTNRSLTVKGENLSFKNLIADHFNTHIYLYQSSFINEKFMSIFPWAVGILTIFTAYYSKIKNKFTKNELNSIKFLVIVLIIIFSLTMIYPFLLRTWFLTGFQVFYLVIASIILSKLFEIKFGKIILFIILILMLIFSTLRLKELYTVNDLGGVSKIYGKQNALNYIQKDSNGEKYNLLIFFPPVYTFPYDYLIFLQNKQNNIPVPGQEKKGLVYLLIEPDPWQAWSYQGWLKTVVGDGGKVIYEKNLPTGFIIQKRRY